MTTKDFAERLGLARRSGQKTGLIVGLDGGAVLLGHPRPEKFLGELCHPKPIFDVLPQDRSARWQEMDGLTRENMLLRNTSPADLDRKACDVVSWLLRENYFKAILISDPSKALCTLLQEQGIALRMFDCAMNRPSLLLELGQWRDKRSVFVDGADVVLPFEQSYVIEDRMDLEAVRQSLGTYLTTFDLLACWTWSAEMNLELAHIFKPKERQLYALGWYTAFSPRFNAVRTYTSVSEPDAHRMPDAEVLLAIARELGFSNEGGGPAHTPKRPSGPLPAAGPDQWPSDSTALPSLVLERGVCERIAQAVLRSKVSLIGVEGEQVRGRVTLRVVGQLDRSSGPALLGRYSDLKKLHDLKRLLAGSACPKIVAAEIMDGSLDPGNQAVATMRVLHDWHDTATNGNFSAVFFVPAALIEMIQRTPFPGGRTDSFHAQALFARECMTPRVVRQWIDAHVGQFLDRSAGEVGVDPALEALARRMVEHMGERDGLAFDRLHEAIDMWYRELRQQAAGTTDRTISLTECQTLWDTVIGRLQAEAPATEGEFDLGPIRPRREQGEDGEDFDLGQIVRRSRKR